MGVLSPNDKTLNIVIKMYWPHVAIVSRAKALEITC